MHADHVYRARAGKIFGDACACGAAHGWDWVEDGYPMGND